MYYCPVCVRVSETALALARHMIGLGDKVHREWINSKGFKFGDLLGLQLKSFCGEDYKALTDMLEEEAKMADKPPV